VVLAVKSGFQGRNKKWLFIFDSADSLDNEEDKSHVDLRSYIPDDVSVHVIVTTQVQHLMRNGPKYAMGSSSGKIIKRSLKESRWT